MLQMNRQPAKPDGPRFAWKTLCFSRWHRLGLDLTQIQGKKSEDRFQRGSVLINKDERSRNTPLSMLPCGLLQKEIEWIAAAVEAVPVM